MAINSPGSTSRDLPRLAPLSTSNNHQQQHRLTKDEASNIINPSSEIFENMTSKSPGTPRVFTFPPQAFDYNTRRKIFSNESNSMTNSTDDRESLNSDGIELLNDNNTPSTAESSVFEFCTKRKKTFVKTQSYSPKSTATGCINKETMEYSSTDQSQQSIAGKNNSINSELMKRARRNSCFNLGGIKNISNFGGGGGGGGCGGGDKRKILNSRNVESTPKLSTNDRFDYYCDNNTFVDGKKKKELRLGNMSLNKSQGCLEENFLLDNVIENNDYNDFNRGNCRKPSRKSTSDLNDIENDTASGYFTPASPSASPVNRSRRGSMKTGGLAYLASRRGSRDSQISNISNISNEDIGPLNFSAHPRGRQRRTSNFLELPVADHVRPRVHSLPEKPYNPRAAGDDLYRLRAFSITHKGVVMNRGDSIISRRSRSNTSVNSSRNSNVSGESRSPFEGSCCSGQGVAADSTTDESDVETNIPKYRVVLLGDSGVGKSALVSQFMTSEYMNTYDASLDDEFGEKTVSILLDGEESEMVFIDHPHVEMSVENSLSTYEPHACIVVYSIVSRGSFQVAEEMLNYLWQEHFTKERSVIVVGNKSDLARSRKITSNDGKQLATSRECKFIETSSGIQHNVDELLVGTLKQIRLRETLVKKLRRQGSRNKGKHMLTKLHNSKTALSLNLARDMLNKICLNDSKSKSCENLHVL